MQIKLTQSIPSVDGYFLMKMSSTEGLHLVLIQTNLDGTRVLIPDGGRQQKLVDIGRSHAELFKSAYFSEQIQIVYEH